jgi:hypothetical protein
MWKQIVNDDSGIVDIFFSFVNLSNCMGQSTMFFTVAVTFLVLVLQFSQCEIGPSAGTSKPFMRALTTDVRIVTVLNSGWLNERYLVGGVMDGLGAIIDDSDPTRVIVYMNHELPFTGGRTRDHGARGAYVSRLVLNRMTMKVEEIRDFLSAPTANRACNAASSAEFERCSFDRLCSGDLPPVSALFNSRSGLGTRNRVFFGGEEGDAFPRAFAFVEERHSAGPSMRFAQRVPSLASMRYENIVLCPHEQDVTVAALSDDFWPSGFVGVYVGRKRDAGSDVERAGLVGGTLYSFAVDGLRGAIESPASTLPTDARFSLVSVQEMDGTLPLYSHQLRDRVRALNGTLFSRPEDLAWGLRGELLAVSSDNDATSGGRSRLWEFVFDDIGEPTRGGRVRWLLDGTEGATMMDNIAVDYRGVSYIAEDSTNPSHNNRFFEFDGSSAPRYLAEHDFEQFASTSLDAEFSGQIDVSHLFGDGWLLVSSQAHGMSRENGTDEASQLLAVRVRKPLVATVVDAVVDEANKKIVLTVLDPDVVDRIVVTIGADSTPTTLTNSEYNPSSAPTDPAAPFKSSVGNFSFDFEREDGLKLMFSAQVFAVGQTKATAFSKEFAFTGEVENSAWVPAVVTILVILGVLFIALVVYAVIRARRKAMNAPESSASKTTDHDSETADTTE